MITPQEAEQLISTCVIERREEMRSLRECTSGIIAENIYADSDLPPFDRVMMDGIAIRSEDFHSGIRSFNIVGIQRAGIAASELHESGSCIEIMTGAVCCIGADVVIPYEQCQIADGICTVTTNEIRPFQNIHHRGTDFKAGELLISKDSSIGPAEIGICASVGKSEIKLYAAPRIIIYSTGEELVDIEQTPLAHQIRKSNVFVLQHLLQSRGYSCELSHLPDDANAIRSTLEKALKDYDIILMSGGVSKGKYDYIPDVLDALGVEKIFHRIAQKPGKPMWFGRTNRSVIFGFPGNPVSTMMCAVRYFLPWLSKTHREKNVYPIQVITTEDIIQKSGLTIFQPAKNVGINENGTPIYEVIKFGGSGDFAGLSGSDAFLEIPAGPQTIKQGSIIKAWYFH